MKWTTMQLNKYVNQVFAFDGEIDLTDRVDTDFDITKIDKVKVSGKMQIVDERYIFDINLSTIIYLECAITLEEVPVEINESFIETFSKNKDLDDNLIEGITIDLSDVIWLNILSVKPMRVVKEGIESPFETKREEKKEVNSAFKDLEKFL
ncbi:hypothetical protein RJG79_07025 [Mycoplasmatota bacterium WC44]